MPPPELGARRAVLHRLPDELAGIGIGLQQPHDVAADLTDVVVLDAAAQARQQPRPRGLGVGPPQGDLHGAVVVDGRAWVVMSSSPITHVPSSTRNFQLCHAQVIRLPSSEPCVIP